MSLNRPRRARRALILALATLGALAIAEVVARVDALFPGAVWTAPAMRAHLERLAAAADYGDLLQFAPGGDVADPSSHRPIPDPWSGWTSPAHVERFAQATAWFAGEEHRATFDVVILGGSFAAQFGNRLDDTHRARLLPPGAPPERAVRTWNFAHAAQKQPSHVNRLLAMFAAGWQPDLVLLVDGFNEVAIAAQNAEAQISPEMPSITFWEVLARSGDVDGGALDRLIDVRDAQRALSASARTGLDFGLWRSALLSRAWLARLEGRKAGLASARTAQQEWLARDRGRAAVRGPRVEPARAEGVPVGVVEGVRAWAAGARHARHVCDGRRVPLVHVLQPALDDAGAKVATEEETRTGYRTGVWPPAIRAGYPLLRAAVEELAGERVPVLDATRAFAAVPETVFVDGCHLSAHGYDLFAETVLPAAHAAVGAR